MLVNVERGLGLKRRASGFSLIELLVVLVILGLLVSIVAPNVLDQADQARVKKVQADFTAISTALKIYRLDNFAYPSTDQGIEALVTKTSIDPVPRNFKQSGYLDEVPLDPWGRPYQYLSPAEYGSGEFDLFTYGADGVSGGEGQNADIGNWQKEGSEEG